MTEPSTPLMRQYAAIKKQHPNALLFFRLGDFYELFFEDAVVAARELQITLTSRNKEKDHAIPMCGVPYHAAENYLSKLLRKGFKVAICEQMEDPSAGQEAGAARGHARAHAGDGASIPAWARRKTIFWRRWRGFVSGGRSGAGGARSFYRRISRHGVSRAGCRAAHSGRAAAVASTRSSCIPPGCRLFDQRAAEPAAKSNQRDDARRCEGSRNRNTNRPTVGQRACSKPANARALLRRRWKTGSLRRTTPFLCLENKLGVLSLEGFGLQGRPAAATAAGAILHYVRSTQRGTLEHVDRIGFYDRQEYLVLDAVTVRNLELVEPLFANTGSEVTLFRALDATLTPMGKRLLRSWMLRPSIDIGEINQRLDAVEAGVKEFVAREELRRALEGVLDIERLLSRVTLETANPRDVLALCASLNRIPRIKVALARLDAARLAELNGLLDEMSDLRERIEKTVVAEPPLTLADGGVIQPDVDKELDELRNLSRNSKQYIAQIEERERKRTGINSLKVKFNSIFGYYIEISKANLHHAPAGLRTQTDAGERRALHHSGAERVRSQGAGRAGEDRRD